MQQHSKTIEKMKDVADEVQEMGLDNIKQLSICERKFGQLQECISELQAENIELRDELIAV